MAVLRVIKKLLQITFKMQDLIFVRIQMMYLFMRCNSCESIIYCLMKFALDI